MTEGVDAPYQFGGFSMPTVTAPAFGRVQVAANVKFGVGKGGALVRVDQMTAKQLKRVSGIPGAYDLVALARAQDPLGRVVRKQPLSGQQVPFAPPRKLSKKQIKAAARARAAYDEPSELAYFGRETPEVRPAADGALLSPLASPQTGFSNLTWAGGSVRTLWSPFYVEDRQGARCW